jgi:hypothetical protein
MRYFLFICLFIVNVCFANSSSIRSLPGPRSIVQVETFAIPPGGKQLTIIYGNEEIGYFQRILDSSPDQKKIDFEFVPPSYMAPINFQMSYVDHKGNTVKKPLLRKKYKSTIPHSFRGKASGELTFPFFIFNGIIQKKEETLFIPMVMNKLGEIIWYFVPEQSI